MDQFNGGSLASTGTAATANVGGYAIIASNAAGGSFDPANYTIAYLPGTLTVRPRAVMVTADAGQGKVQGDPDPALTYGLTAGSLVGLDAFSGALFRAAGEDVGDYAIGQGTLTLSPNYVLSYLGATFVITARAVVPEPLPSFPSPMTNIWAVTGQHPAWFGGQAGETPGADDGYVQTNPREGFKLCNSASIVAELAEAGQVQLSGASSTGACDVGNEPSRP